MDFRQSSGFGFIAVVPGEHEEFCAHLVGIEAATTRGAGLEYAAPDTLIYGENILLCAVRMICDGTPAWV